MSMIRTTVLCIALATGGLAAGNAAAANHFELWNGSAWVQDGTTHLAGPTTATYLGNSLPCNADFTLKVTAGVATVTAASFSGSSACTGITSRGLPWTVAITSGSGSSWSITVGGSSTSSVIGGVNIRIPFPGIPVDCPTAPGRGPINGTLTNGSSTAAAAFSFPTQTLGPCSVASRTTPAPGHLRTTGYWPARIMP